MKDKLFVTTLSLGHAITHWHVGAFYLILPYIAQDFSLSFSQAGTIVAARSIVSASANIPSGAIADVFRRKRLMMAIAVLWPAVFYLAVGIADQYSVILLCSALIGFGSSLWHGPAMSELSDRFPQKKGFALSMHETGANLGDFLAPIAIGFMLASMSWRHAVLANVAPAIVVAVLIWFIVRDARAGRRGGLPWQRYRSALAGMFLNKRLLAISAISAARTMAQNALNTFLPIYLAFQAGLPPASVGMYVGMLTFASLFSGPVMGTISDTTGRRPILSLGMLASAALVILLAILKAGPSFLVILVALGLFLYSSRPVIFAYALDITPKEMGSTAVSFVFGINQIFSSLSPVIAGLIADRFGLIFSFYFVAALLLLAFITTLLLPGRAAEIAERRAATG